MITEAKNLKYLDLSGENTIENLYPIVKLTKLKALHINQDLGKLCKFSANKGLMEACKQQTNITIEYTKMKNPKFEIRGAGDKKGEIILSERVFEFFEQNGKFEWIHEKGKKPESLKRGWKAVIFLVKDRATNEVKVARLTYEKSKEWGFDKDSKDPKKPTPPPPKLEAKKHDEGIQKTTGYIFYTQEYGPFKIMRFLKGDTLIAWLKYNELFTSTPKAKKARKKLEEFLLNYMTEGVVMNNLKGQNIIYDEELELWIAFDGDFDEIRTKNNKDETGKINKCDTLTQFELTYLNEGKAGWKKHLSTELGDLPREDFDNFFNDFRTNFFKDCVFTHI